MAATEDVIETQAGIRRGHAAAWLVPLAMVLGALVFVGVAPAPVPQWFEGQDKLHHAAALLVFSVTLRAAFPRLGWRGFAVTCAAVGGGIELVQALFAQRTASLADFGADLIGALLGWWAWSLLRERS